MLLIGLLLLTREIFYVVTNNKIEQYKERLFYPFAAGTELAAVVLFLVPGLVPLKRELAEATRVTSYVSLCLPLTLRLPTHRPLYSKRWQLQT